jgi:hypothetical protein
MIVPPALLSGGHANRLLDKQRELSRLLLEVANMRVDRIRHLHPIKDSVADLPVRIWRMRKATKLTSLKPTTGR